MNDVSGIALNANIQKALRFGSGSLKNEINGYIESTKAAEAADQLEADKVIAAFSARQSGRQAQPLVQQLAAAKQRALYIEKICGGYDKAAAQIQRFNDEKTAATNRLIALRTQRDSLGLFAGKEKKRLDGEISEIVAGMKRLDLKLTSACEQLGGFESKTVADKALSEARADVSSLQNMINVASISGSREFSCSQALKVLLAKPRVFQFVSKKQPLLASSYKGFVTIAFGRYPQASKNENALIEWLVLKNDGSRALLISKYALDCQQYNTSFIKNVTWETCSLRKWLNGSFINSAFSADEQKEILNAAVTADRNPDRANSGNNTKDRVFLLSIAEAQKYFGSDSARQCQGTVYCFAQGAYKVGDGYCLWRLRSPGSSGCAAYVYNGGSINEWGHYVDNGTIAVRPALWINLGS